MLSKYAQAIRVFEAKLAKGQKELEVGLAELERAQTLASYLEIKAPFSGIVTQRHVDPGNLVRPDSHSTNAQPLLTVSQVEKLRAVFHATTDVAGSLQAGAMATFVADDLPGMPFQDQLSRLAGSYNSRTRMMRGEMDLGNKRNPESGLRPLRAGSYGTITIVLQSENASRNTN